MEKENLTNMQKCPRFEKCSIPRCPIDKDMSERVELKEEEKCILFKILGGNRSKRTKGNISPRMRNLVRFIPK